MSVFKVRLVSPSRSSGYAEDPAVVNGVSLQKTMDVTGPNLSRRRLADGETFTSTNYWKRYATVAEGGMMSDEDAIVTILSDDGTAWSDTNPRLNRFARAESLVVVAGTTYTNVNNQIDILGDFGGVATFCQLTTDEEVNVRLNGSTSAQFELASGSLTFDDGDMPITSLAFDNSESGATNANVDVLMTIELISHD